MPSDAPLSEDELTKLLELCDQGHFSLVVSAKVRALLAEVREIRAKAKLDPVANDILNLLVCKSEKVTALAAENGELRERVREQRAELDSLHKFISDLEARDMATLKERLAKEPWRYAMVNTTTDFVVTLSQKPCEYTPAPPYVEFAVYRAPPALAAEVAVLREIAKRVGEIHEECGASMDSELRSLFEKLAALARGTTT